MQMVNAYCTVRDIAECHCTYIYTLCFNFDWLCISACMYVITKHVAIMMSMTRYINMIIIIKNLIQVKSQ